MPRFTKVPVGMTPIQRYDSWDAHRRDIHQDCEYRLRKRAYQFPKAAPVA